MRTGLTKQEKTTDIWFDEKDPLIHIRTHNTALKKRLLAYSRRYPAICQQTDADPETGCMEFDIEKGRFSFRLTAPYTELIGGQHNGYIYEIKIKPRVMLRLSVLHNSLIEAEM